MAKKVLITGASSGIGRDMAKIFDSYGCELILVARREDRLRALAECLNGTPRIIPMDIGTAQGAQVLYELTKNENIDILINNAGFGVFGDFTQTSTARETEMIRLNVEAMHILFKLFLKDFKEKNSGYILNTASAAAFAPGPYMAAYYASKAYVLRLTQAVAYELEEADSEVSVSALCPGPVATEFNKVAGVHFSVSPLSSKYVAQYAIQQMFRKKTVIIPGTSMKLAALASKIVPSYLACKVCAEVQKHKGNTRKNTA